MKKIIIFALLFFIPVPCAADDFKLSWDYGDHSIIDGFSIYSGPMGQDEDGEWYPKLGEDPLLTGIPPDARTAEVVENGWPEVKKKFCFVARAYKAEDESADSNMVCVEIDNTPLLAPSSLVGQWNKSDETITLSWIQDDAERAKYWKIFYKIGDGEYVDFAKSENNGSDSIEVKVPFDEAPMGEITSVTWAVVAFKDEAVFSPDSNPVVIDIDRSGEIGEIPPPVGLRFEATIKVQ